jgi:hypothetical protein
MQGKVVKCDNDQFIIYFASCIASFDSNYSTKGIVAHLPETKFREVSRILSHSYEISPKFCVAKFIKGTVSRDFRQSFFSLNGALGYPDLLAKTALSIGSNSRRNLI